MRVQLDNTKQNLSARNDQVYKNYSCFETDFGEDLTRYKD